MIGLDTNVLVRFFLQDDPMQSAKAGELMNSLTAEVPGWVGVPAMLELVWVLESKNRFDRKTIAQTLDRLLSLKEIVIEREEVVLESVMLFKRGKADFADCLIASSARAAGCSRTVTLDGIGARDAGMELIA